MKFLRFFFVTIVSMFLVCYVFHMSIITYVVQQYHYLSDEINKEYIFFALGNSIAKKLDSMRLALFESKHATQEYSTSSNNTKWAKKESDFLHNKEQTYTQATWTYADSKNDHNALPQHTENIMNKNQILPDNSYINDAKARNSLYAQKGIKLQDEKLYVAPNTQFLLIGDSLMQGIAITLTKALRDKEFKVKNIAQQSTGLTYPTYLDWPEKTRQELKQNPNIGVLVVCLGANDPWDMPKIKFNSDEWIRVYKERIQSIFDIAKEHNVFVIWYQVPPVKKDKLSERIAILNKLYEEVLEANGGLFVYADAILRDGQFSTSIKDETGKTKATRAQDGIHFTRYGSALLTQTLMQKIVVEKPISEDPFFYFQPQPMPLEKTIENNTQKETIRQNNTQDLLQENILQQDVFMPIKSPNNSNPSIPLSTTTIKSISKKTTQLSIITAQHKNTAPISSLSDTKKTKNYHTSFHTNFHKHEALSENTNT